MTPPVDLTALREMVEAVGEEHASCDGERAHGLRAHPCKACDLLPAAREALERLSVPPTVWRSLDEGMEKAVLYARIARLEAEIAYERGCSECWKGASCGTDCQMNDVVEGRDE